MNLTDKFINLIWDKFANIDDESIKEAKICFLDFYCCAFAGHLNNPDLVYSFPMTSSLKCQIIGESILSTCAEQAAFINAFNVHSTELDDGFKEGLSHIGAVVVSAAFALSQEKAIPIERLLRGIVIGYEATARLSRAINPFHKQKGFHTTGTCAAIGAALGSALMLGCDKLGLKVAFSIALTSASGLLEIQEDSSQLKAVNAAKAAMDAVAAARLSLRIIIPPNDMLGGKRGFINVLNDGVVDESTLLDKEGGFFISKRYMKLYPACRHCHPAIEASLMLSADFDEKKVSEIIVETYGLAINGHDHVSVNNVSSAKLSIPYTVAASLLNRSFDLSIFNNGLDAKTVSLAKKVTIKEDKLFTEKQQKERSTRVTINFFDGNSIAKEVHYAKGDPENPLSLEEFREKFKQLTSNGIAEMKIFDNILKK